ncbi:MAG: RDD family protein [Gammaproteobacteria bacterium]
MSRATCPGASTWPRAGLLRRLASVCYDLLVVAALLMLLTALVILIRGGDAVGPGAVWFQVLLIGCWWLYFAWSWTHGGQTVGMRAWRMVLVPSAGGRVTWREASLRFAAAALSALMLGLGFLAALIDAQSRTWHDRLSGTELRVRPKIISQPIEEG